MRSILIAAVLGIAGVAGLQEAPADPVAQPQADAALAKQRTLNLERLRVYLETGEFAADEENRPASVFRDPKGRLCAMAYLIAASGRMDLVDEVARTNNRLQLADVKEGPLWDWMLASGLTREEIVRIQGIPRDGFEFLPGREQGPTITASAPTPARLHANAVKKGKSLLREMTINNVQSLAVAESRQSRKR
jgi:hypothetical protein